MHARAPRVPPSLKLFLPPLLSPCVDAVTHQRQTGSRYIGEHEEEDTNEDTDKTRKTIILTISTCPFRSFHTIPAGRVPRSSYYYLDLLQTSAMESVLGDVTNELMNKCKLRVFGVFNIASVH